MLSCSHIGALYGNSPTGIGLKHSMHGLALRMRAGGRGGMALWM